MAMSVCKEVKRQPTSVKIERNETQDMIIDGVRCHYLPLIVNSGIFYENCDGYKRLVLESSEDEGSIDEILELHAKDTLRKKIPTDLLRNSESRNRLNDVHICRKKRKLQRKCSGNCNNDSFSSFKSCSRFKKMHHAQKDKYEISSYMIDSYPSEFSDITVNSLETCQTHMSNRNHVTADENVDVTIGSFSHNEVKHITPILNYSTPILNYGTPMLNYTAPILNYSTPMLNYSTPMLNYCTPMLEYSTQVSEVPYVMHHQSMENKHNLEIGNQLEEHNPLIGGISDTNESAFVDNFSQRSIPMIKCNISITEEPNMEQQSIENEDLQIEDASEDKIIFFGGIGNADENDLKKYFSKFGNVMKVNIKKDPYTGLSRGFAFITFENEDSVNTVLQERYHRINGKRGEAKRTKHYKSRNNYRTPVRSFQQCELDSDQ